MSPGPSGTTPLETNPPAAVPASVLSAAGRGAGSNGPVPPTPPVLLVSPASGGLVRSTWATYRPSGKSSNR